MDEINRTLAELSARVQRLEDERAITRVLTRYGFAVDIGDADATAALYTDDTVIDLGPTSQFHGSAGARQLVLDERHQAIVGRCAHTMGPFVIDLDINGDRATATGYVRVYISDDDMLNPRLWRIGYTKLELVRSGATWRIATRLSRSVGAEDGQNLLRGGLA
ncbi:MAG: nuclear transport factor 2 family protein [Acidimicrobiales bacterium]